MHGTELQPVGKSEGRGRERRRRYRIALHDRAGRRRFLCAGEKRWKNAGRLLAFCGKREYKLAVNGLADTAKLKIKVLDH